MIASMKKTFPLQSPGKDDARVRDKIRHEVNRCVRRERRRDLPEGFDGLEFTCRLGTAADSAQPLLLKEIAAAIDAVALTGSTQVYIEVIAVPVARRLPPAPEGA